jgi:hypothetical protein
MRGIIATSSPFAYAKLCESVIKLTATLPK